MNTKKNYSPALIVLLAIFCNILWGSAYPGIKLGYAAFNITTLPQTLLFAGIRFAVAGLLLLLLTGIKTKSVPLPKKKNVPIILLMAVIYTTIQYIFFYIGLSNTTGTNGSIVNSTTTFMAPILAHFVYKDEKLNARKIIGTLIGFAGVLIVTLSGGSGKVSFLGEGFIAIAALAFVVGSMISKKATRTENSTIVSIYNLLIGGIILIVIALIGGAKFETVSWQGIAGLLYLCLLSAGAYTIWTFLLTFNPLSKISIYNFIIPISGTILSAIFLNENVFGVKYLFSLVLVCTGIIVVNKSPKGLKK